MCHTPPREPNGHQGGATRIRGVCRPAPESAKVWEHALASSADVAQLVAHHLAKVRVASSNLVIRSDPIRVGSNTPHGGVAERRGSGLQSRQHGFESRRHLAGDTARTDWAIGAAVARFPDTEEVTGSNPVSPTTAGSMGSTSPLSRLCCCSGLSEEARQRAQEHR